MKKIALKSCCLLFIILISWPLATKAQTEPPNDEYFQARVLALVEERVEELDGYIQQTQELSVVITNGREQGQTVTAINAGIAGMEKFQAVGEGNKIIVVKIENVDGGTNYYVVDHYRLPQIYWILVAFVALALFFGRWKGLGALLGLGFSLLILAYYIIPQIIEGVNPLLVTLSGTVMIASVSLFLAHGFNRRTWLAFSSTMITLIIGLVISKLFVGFAFLFGTGTEEAYYVQVGNLANVDLRGLLLAGIMIGTLGVLDDITTAQTAVVGELKLANPNFTWRELYRRGLVVGKEHISSLVNTLVLAYASASLPLFILYATNDYVPIWLQLNSELFAEEIVRTVIGSIALILAVPIATLLAAYFLQTKTVEVK